MHTVLWTRQVLNIPELFLVILVIGALFNYRPCFVFRRLDFGLKGEAIPLLVRLFALVDVYDVITHDRLYKEAMDKHAALQEIAVGGGAKF